MSLNESYPQHVVTAVIVAHDGAAWLPRVADALLGQTRPVQRVVAVDTGSRDRSGAVLTGKFGRAAAFGMERSTSYGTAIAKALQHRAANVPVPNSPAVAPADRVEWLWLLHDDSEPAPDALEQLLRGAAEASAAAVLGPKVKDWTNREVIVEAGVTLDTAARRVTGIEPREVDQGQHDGDRDALAVSSAGMLVRRDVWEMLGGFDQAMSLFMEDIDFCWRVHSAGFRVRVITDAVVYHVQASAKRRRPVSVGRRPAMLDRRNGLLTLLGNLPLRQTLTSAAGNAILSLLRITFFLLAKRMIAALDEAAALAAVIGHPFRLATARRFRARGRRAAYNRVRADLPSGRSGRRLFEFAALAFLKSAQNETTGAHHASIDPTDDDSMLVDNGLGKRILTSPSVLTFVLLLTVTLVACRSLLASGPLGGGSLVPVWGGASDLWRTYLQAFHPIGIGSTATAPPYVAIVAALATVLAGKTWLAVDVILIGSVPLAGMTAMRAVRRLTRSAPVRIWASASYALLPVATGVISGGRFGSAVAFVLLPLIALQAGRIFTRTGRDASRAAWGTGLLVAIGVAFVPMLWIGAVIACMVAAIIAGARPVVLRNLVVVILTAPVLLLPWTLTLISHPGTFLFEAGLPQAGTPAGGLAARNLLLLSPGGPGLPPYWVTAGLMICALAGLFARRRRRLIMAGWGVALCGLLAAIGVSHLKATPVDGSPFVVWAGLPLAVAGLGLLLAGAAGADALSNVGGGGTRGAGWRGMSGDRRLLVGLLVAVGCSAPLLAAGSWLRTGVTGPVHPVTSQVVPELVAVADGQSHQVRTLVLSSAGGRVSYLLLRGPSPSLADAELTPPANAQHALDSAVATLISPSGGLAANQSQLLANFDIGYVLVRAPVDPNLAAVLNSVSGLRPYSTTDNYDLWQTVTTPSRVSVLERNGTVVPIASGPAGVSGASAPSAGGTLLLAEPAGGWTAKLNGQSLTQVQPPVGDGWAQAFRLPAGGGSLDIGHSGLGHDLLLLLQLLLVIAIAAMALPGIAVAELDSAAASPPDEELATAARESGDAAVGPEGEQAEAPMRSRRLVHSAGLAAATRGRRSSRAQSRGRGKPKRVSAARDNSRGRHGRPADVADAQGSRRTAARPYDDISEPGADRSVPRHGSPQSRAWPYADEAGGPRGWDTGPRSPSGRSPSGRAPDPAWADPADGYSYPRNGLGGRDGEAASSGRDPYDSGSYERSRAGWRGGRNEDLEPLPPRRNGPARQPGRRNVWRPSPQARDDAQPDGTDGFDAADWDRLASAERARRERGAGRHSARPPRQEPERQWRDTEHEYDGDSW